MQLLERHDGAAVSKDIEMAQIETAAELHKRWLQQDPDYRAEFDALEDEFRAIEAAIAASSSTSSPAPAAGGPGLGDWINKKGD
ncbi:MAG TPA: hypothetical protein VGU69_10615 [Rhizomicrobium sp.]|nr:hypothetical protein [Rhizomicrobium sp.]